MPPTRYTSARTSSPPDLLCHEPGGSSGCSGGCSSSESASGRCTSTRRREGSKPNNSIHRHVDMNSCRSGRVSASTTPLSPHGWRVFKLFKVDDSGLVPGARATRFAKSGTYLTGLYKGQAGSRWTLSRSTRRRSSSRPADGVPGHFDKLGLNVVPIPYRKVIPSEERCTALRSMCTPRAVHRLLPKAGPRLLIDQGPAGARSGRACLSAYIKATVMKCLSSPVRLRRARRAGSFRLT